MIQSKDPPVPSDRSFGFTFAVVLALAGAWMLWSARDYFYVPFSASLVFLAAALLFPGILHPLNVAWMRLGLLLNRVVSPIVLGIMFFGILTPVAMVMRIRGRDALQRRADPARPSYWIVRNPPGPEGSSFAQQF
jgi:hypothetical protein